MTSTVPVPQSGPTFRVPRWDGPGRPVCAGSPATAAISVLPENPAPGERGAVQAALEDCGFNVRWSVAATTCTVTVVGDLDSFTAPFLLECLLDVLSRPDLGSDIAVDLSQVTFLSAAGLTVLCTGRLGAYRVGRAFGIRCGTAPAVIRLLHMTGLWNVFTLVE